MKFLTVMVALAAAAAGAYYLFLKDSAPYAAYKSFASAIANGDKERALRYADAPEALGESGDRVKNVGGMPVESLVGIAYAKQAETKNPDGTVTVEAIQSVRFDPPGATSAMGAMTAKYRQRAILRKSKKGWLVSSMTSEFLEIRNWKGEKE